MALLGSASRPLTSALSVPFGGEIVDFDPKQWVRPRKSLKVMSRDIQYGFAAAELAMADAGIAPGTAEPERFGVVVNLLSIERRQRVRLRVQVPEADLSLPSLFDMYPGTEAMEREAYDMFGIQFSDHPDLTRILMPEDWDGFPLRKDYDQGRIPVQFSGDFAARSGR